MAKVGHYVRYLDNFHGQRVERCFTKRVMDGEWYVHERVLVDGQPTDDRYFKLDVADGRDRLAQECVAPDMLREE